MLVVSLLSSRADAQTPAVGRRIAVVYDTSNSMKQRDTPRNSIQLAKILSDLVRDSDAFALVVMPEFSLGRETSGTIDRSLIRVLDVNHRAAYKDILESIQYRTSTAMLTPTLTAIDWLNQRPDQERLLIILTDADSFDCCHGEIASALRAARGRGVTMAAIGVGEQTKLDELLSSVPIRRTAKNPGEIAATVAEVYQRFLGGRNVVQGATAGQVFVDIDPYVREAFIVVTMDGAAPVPTLGPSNPGAQAIDLDFRGGHQTVAFGSHDVRGYRIVRLQRPKPGRWTIQLPSSAPGAFLLVQDYGIAPRLVSSRVPVGKQVPVNVDLVDDEGGRITDRRILEKFKVTAEIEGRTVQPHDDGADGDTTAGDGIFTIEQPFARRGSTAVRIHIASPLVERDQTFPLTVVNTGVLRGQLPATVDLDGTTVFHVEFDPLGSGQPAPDRVQVSTPGGLVSLPRVSVGPNGVAAYEQRWKPADSGTHAVAVTVPGYDDVPPLEGTITVHGRIRWPNPPPIVFPKLAGSSEVTTTLDFAGADILGTVSLRVTSDMECGGCTLTLQDGGERIVGSGSDYRLAVSALGPRRWVLRLKSGECPGACARDVARHLDLTAERTGGRETIRVPLVMEVVPDAWYYCWRYEIAGALATIATGFIWAGVYLPSRFRRGLGVQLGDTPRVDDGVAYLIRTVRGSRAGFYRDARVFITSDHQVVGRSRHALIRLRARGGSVMMRPELGTKIWRQSTGRRWEPVDDVEGPMELGALYRAGENRLFFELRAL